MHLQTFSSVLGLTHTNAFDISIPSWIKIMRLALFSLEDGDSGLIMIIIPWCLSVCVIYWAPEHDGSN